MTEDPEYRRPRLRDDTQQWELDRAIMETGRVQHFFAGRKLPQSVRTHAMISKHLAKPALRLERMAVAEEEAGHTQTALELYADAAVAFCEAQHPIFTNNEEKQFLHGSAIRCYDQVRRLSPTTIEHVHVPFEGKLVSGYLHLAPVEGPAPLVFFIPGCDMTKERAPHPLRNWATKRGMHLFSFDGPGQGESNLRDLVLTVDNYEAAASTALTHLLERPEIDATRVGLYSLSFGSYWGARFAATDDRLAATVLQWASVADKRYQFDGAVSPRYKQLLSYMTRATSEGELDDFIAAMDLDPLVGQIQSPTLVTVGEYDPRSPLDDVLRFFDALRAPAEMWVFADEQHSLKLRIGFQTSLDSHVLGMDWLRDRLDGKPLTRAGEVTWLEPNGPTPSDPSAPSQRRWFEQYRS